ncbi:MAG: histidine phosphatase family protein [Thermoanaerobaculales bacterium]|jgi:probable phosphoglycerate mutase|nr:histidine phosphatase family protein [Thermoanaerobaculales bacterium]
MELWLVRHGETTHSAARRIAGWCDPPLTERGRAQAAAVRAQLDGAVFDGVWSSDLQRAVESARLGWGEPRQDRRLRECNFGSWEGSPYEAVDRDHAEVFLEFRAFAIEGGDSHESFRRRVTSFVDQLEPGRHLLFVHGGVIRILTQDLGLDRFVATGSVVGVDWAGRRLLFVREPGASGE